MTLFGNKVYTLDIHPSDSADAAGEGDSIPVTVTP